MSAETLSGGSVSIPVRSDVTGFGSKLREGLGAETAGLADIGKKMGGLLVGGLAAAGVAVGIGEIFKKGFEEYSAADAINAQFNAGIKSTGNAANLSVKSMDDLAKSISGYSGQSYESIGKTEQVLQTFTNLRNVGPNKIFDQATVAASNMAAKLGGDASASAIQLGKALNDPVKGMTALRRVGVAFTQSQTNQVKAMVASGNILGAQKVILAELTTEFGGAAKAAGETFPGALARTKVAFGELSKAGFAAIVPILLPAINGIANALVKATPFVEDFSTKVSGKLSDGLKAAAGPMAEFGKFLSKAFDAAKPIVEGFGDSFKPVLAAVGGAFEALMPTIEKLLPAFLQLSTTASPLMLVFKALAPVLPQIVGLIGTLAATISGGLLKVILQIMPSVSKLAGILSTVLAKVIADLMPIIVKLVGILGPILSAVLSAVGPLFSTLAGVVGTLLQALIPVIDPIMKLVSTLLDLIAPLLQLVGPILTLLITMLGPLLTPILDAVKQSFKFLVPIIASVVSVIKDILTPVIKEIITVLGGVIDFLTGVFTGNWSKAWTGITEIFKGIFNGMLGIAQGLVNGIIDLINGVINGIDSVGKSVGINIGVIPHWAGKLPGLAEGGTVLTAGRVLVGERGPEILNLQKGATVTPLDKAHAPINISVVEANNSYATGMQVFRILNAARS